MSNDCTGFMNVRGYAPNVDEFIKILNANYTYYKDSKNYDYTWCADPKNFSHIPHFFRVFQAIPFEEVWNSGIYKCVSIDIDVAWSVWCCMFPGEYTYYDDFQKVHPNQHFGSHILAESKRLQLEIEIWSYEPGVGFQEHYKICSGILVKNEEHNFNTLYLGDYSNYQEFKNACKYEPTISKEMFEERINDEDFYYEEGLQEERVDFIPGDEPEYLANLVMVKPRKE